MERLLADLHCEVYICLDREEYATGVEGRMVALLNEGDAWASGLRLEITEAILAARPFKRFRDVRQLAGIGKTTYKRLHRWAYMAVNGEVTMPSISQECGGDPGQQLPIQYT